MYIYMCVCVYIYVCIYIYTHTYVYICVYIYIYTHLYIYIYICVCVYIYIFIYQTTSFISWRPLCDKLSMIAVYICHFSSLLNSFWRPCFSRFWDPLLVLSTPSTWLSCPLLGGNIWSQCTVILSQRYNIGRFVFEQSLNLSGCIPGGAEPIVITIKKRKATMYRALFINTQT